MNVPGSGEGRSEKALQLLYAPYNWPSKGLARYLEIACIKVSGNTHDAVVSRDNFKVCSDEHELQNLVQIGEHIEKCHE